MTDEVDRKIREVPVAEYRYRHEAEFAAGFLGDAGIPHRLQHDDAGGADLGLSFLRPSVIWVRALDVDDARELLALEEEGPGTLPEPTSTSAPPGAHAARSAGVPAGPRRRDAASGPRLSPLERAVSAGISVALFSAVPYLPIGPYRPYLGGLFLAGGLAFLVATALGRAPGPLARLVRTLSGSPPG